MPKRTAITIILFPAFHQSQQKWNTMSFTREVLFTLSPTSPIIFSVNWFGLVSKMSENSEKYPSKCPKAKGDVFKHVQKSKLQTFMRRGAICTVCGV